MNHSGTGRTGAFLAGVGRLRRALRPPSTRVQKAAGTRRRTLMTTVSGGCRAHGVLLSRGGDWRKCSRHALDGQSNYLRVRCRRSRRSADSVQTRSNAVSLPSVDDVRTEMKQWLEENWNPELTVGEWWEILARSGYAAP